MRSIYYRFHRCHVGGHLATGLCLLLGMPVFGQTEGAIVTKHGATVRGLVEGSVLGLDEIAAVTVESGASVVGDLVMPAEKNPGGTELKRSPSAKVTVADGLGVKGRQRVARGFALPKAASHQKATGRQSVVMEKGSEPEPDFRKLKDLTLRNQPEKLVLPPRTLALPPGNYGKIVVEEGQLLLGRPGSIERVRYTFEHLTMHAGGSIELLSPVILSVGQLGPMDGRIGSKRYTQWLDLRVESGEISFGPGSEVHGVVLADASGVTLGRGAKLRGGVICDRATVESEARFTGIQPSWSPEATGNAAPLFVHKAMRVEQRLAELAPAWEGTCEMSVTYPEDVPALDLTLRAKTPLAREQQVFFEACCALFDGTGFARGVLKFKGTETLALEMERESFESRLLALGQGANLRESIRLVRGDPALCAAFMAGVLSAAAHQ